MAGFGATRAPEGRGSGGRRRGRAWHRGGGGGRAGSRGGGCGRGAGDAWRQALFRGAGQPLGEIAAPLAAAFPGVTLIGASTAGEFTERGDAKGAAVIAAVAGDYRVHAGMGTGLKASPERAIEQAIEGL